VPALRQRAGYRAPSHERAAPQEAVAAARRTLGDADAAAAWAVGESLTLDQAVDEALAEAEE